MTQVVGPQSVRVGLWAYLGIGTRLGGLYGDSGLTAKRLRAGGSAPQSSTGPPALKESQWPSSHIRRTSQPPRPGTGDSTNTIQRP